MRIPCPGCGAPMSTGVGWELCSRCRGGSPISRFKRKQFQSQCPCGTGIHSGSQCARCIREAQRRRAADRRAKWATCAKCGDLMSSSYRSRSRTREPICLNCRRRPRVECAGGCGKAVPAREVIADRYMCQSCRRETIHSASRYDRGCRCDECCAAKSEQQNLEAYRYQQDRNRTLRRSRLNRAKKNAASLEQATARAGKLWLPHEDELIMRGDMTGIHCAVLLGKSYDAVMMRRKRLRKAEKYYGTSTFDA